MNMFSFRSSHWRYSVKKALLKISQIAQENTCVGVTFQQTFGKREGLQLYYKESPTQAFSCFPKKIAKFFRSPILKNIWKRLFLQFLFFFHGSHYHTFLLFGLKLKWLKNGGVKVFIDTCIFLIIISDLEERRMGIAGNSSALTQLSFVIKNLKNSRRANLLANRKPNLLFILTPSKAVM